MKGNMEDTFSLNNGVVFRLKKVPSFILAKKNDQLMESEPKVPMVFLDDKGRNEPNPNDPTYISAHEKWEESKNVKLMDAVIVIGLDIVSVPDSIRALDNNAWIDELVFLEIPVAHDGMGRKLDYIKTQLLTDATDLNTLVEKINEFNGFATEVDVATAGDSFRDTTLRDANTPVSIKQNRGQRRNN